MSYYYYTNRFQEGDEVVVTCDLVLSNQPLFEKERRIDLKRGTRVVISRVTNTTAMTDSLQMVRYSVTEKDGIAAFHYCGIPEVYLDKI